MQADVQSAGRGRLGSSFFSPPGGLYLSVVLRPPLTPDQARVISLAAGLAVAEGIHDSSALVPALKWPNDLLLHGRKVCGLLVDMSTEGQAIRYAILGIGVNVNVRRQVFPLELRIVATSLSAELGLEIDLDDLRGGMLSRLEEHYRTLCDAGQEAVVEGWRRWPNMLGQRVRTAAGAEGIAQDLDATGALILKLDSGEVRRIVAGEVHTLPIK